MKNVRDMDNIAAEELAEILEFLKSLLKGSKKIFYNWSTSKELEKENQAILQAMSKDMNTDGKHEDDEKILLFEMEGLESKQIEQLFDYIGADHAVNRDMGNKSTMMAVYENDIPNLKKAIQELNSGELEWEKVFSEREIVHDETIMDIEHELSDENEIDSEIEESLDETEAGLDINAEFSSEQELLDDEEIDIVPVFASPAGQPVKTDTHTTPTAESTEFTESNHDNTVNFANKPDGKTQSSIENLIPNEIKADTISVNDSVSFVTSGNIENVSQDISFENTHSEETPSEDIITKDVAEDITQNITENTAENILKSEELPSQKTQEETYSDTSMSENWNEEYETATIPEQATVEYNQENVEKESLGEEGFVSYAENNVKNEEITESNNLVENEHLQDMSEIKNDFSTNDKIIESENLTVEGTEAQATVIPENSFSEEKSNDFERDYHEFSQNEITSEDTIPTNTSFENTVAEQPQTDMSFDSNKAEQFQNVPTKEDVYDYEKVYEEIASDNTTNPVQNVSDNIVVENTQAENVDNVSLNTTNDNFITENVQSEHSVLGNKEDVTPSFSHEDFSQEESSYVPTDSTYEETNTFANTHHTDEEIGHEYATEQYAVDSTEQHSTEQHSTEQHSTEQHFADVAEQYATEQHFTNTVEQQSIEHTMEQYATEHSVEQHFSPTEEKETHRTGYKEAERDEIVLGETDNRTENMGSRDVALETSSYDNVNKPEQFSSQKEINSIENPSYEAEEVRVEHTIEEYAAETAEIINEYEQNHDGIAENETVIEDVFSENTSDIALEHTIQNDASHEDENSITQDFSYEEHSDAQTNEYQTYEKPSSDRGDFSTVEQNELEHTTEYREQPFVNATKNEFTTKEDVTSEEKAVDYNYQNQNQDQSTEMGEYEHHYEENVPDNSSMDSRLDNFKQDSFQQEDSIEQERIIADSHYETENVISQNTISGESQKDTTDYSYETSSDYENSYEERSYENVSYDATNATMESPVHENYPTQNESSSFIEEPVRDLKENTVYSDDTLSQEYNNFSQNDASQNTTEYQRTEYENAPQNTPEYQEIEHQNEAYSNMDVNSATYQNTEHQNTEYQSTVYQSVEHQTPEYQNTTYQSEEYQNTKHQSTDAQGYSHHSAEPATQSEYTTDNVDRTSSDFYTNENTPKEANAERNESSYQQTEANYQQNKTEDAPVVIPVPVPISVPIPNVENTSSYSPEFGTNNGMDNREGSYHNNSTVAYETSDSYQNNYTEYPSQNDSSNYGTATQKETDNAYYTSVGSNVDAQTTQDQYRQNFEEERRKQQEIIERNTARKQNPDDVNVVKVGSGNDFRNPQIKLYETELLNDYFKEQDTEALERAGGTVTGIAAQAKNTETYKGYKEVAQELSPLGALAINSSIQKATEIHYTKLLGAERNGDLNSLNKLLESKHTDGLFDRDTTGMLKNGITFVTEDSARVSEIAVMKMLEKKGLVIQDMTGKKASWNTTRFTRMYNKKQYTELARILQIGDHISDAEKKKIIDSIASITTDMGTKNTASKKEQSMVKGTFKKVGKKMVEDSATFSGISSVYSVVVNVRQVYRVGKMGSGAIWKATTRPRRYINQKVVRPMAMKTETGRKIINGETGIQRYNANRKVVKQRKAMEKDIHLSRRAKTKKTREVEKGAAIKRAAKADKYMQNRLRLEGVRAKRTGVFGKMLNKGGAAKDKFTAFFKEGFLKNLIGLPAKIKRKVAIIFGIFVIAMMLLSIVLNFIGGIVPTIPEFSTREDDTIPGVYGTTAGTVVTDLLAMEAQWVKGLQDIQGNEKLNLDDLKFGRNYQSFENYLVSKNFGYNKTTKTGLGPNNLFGLDGLPEEMRKPITQVDGGVELEYQNASGGASRTSNIKDILSMCSVYFFSAYDQKDFVKAVDLSTATDNDTLPQLKKATNVMQDWITPFSTKKENATKPSTIMRQYCTTLFAVSHQEIFDIELVTLPTKNTLSEDIDAEDIELCTGVDGCMFYDGFYYHQGHISMPNSMGEYKDVSPWVVPGDLDADCSKSFFVKDFELSVLSHPRCWDVTYEVYENISNYETISTALDPAEEQIHRAFSNFVRTYCNKNRYNYAYCNVWKIENGKFCISFDDDVEHKTAGDKEFDVNKDYRLIFTHKCAGNHTGYYCGGHYKMRITGQVYGFTDEQVAAVEGGGNAKLVAKVGQGTFTPVATDTTLIDTSKLNTMSDIFDADAALSRPIVSKNWEGWTKSNMEIAVLRYAQDWENLYDITISSALGGTPLSMADKKLIMGQIDKKYPNLSEERRNIILTALDKVGCMGYSQAHHNCKFEGPCTVNPSGACIFSDCSGFASNLWAERFGGTIYTTSSFYSNFKDTSAWSSFNSDDTLPGDILLHYGGGGPGGGDDHALIYLGKIKYNNVFESDLTIDCSTVEEVGNVYLRFRNYYNKCYVVHPDR